MKKISVLALAATCILLVLSIFIPVSAASSYMRGDADGDREVTITDATVIQRKLAEIPVVSFNEKAADIDGDGLNVTDVTFVQRYLADMENIHHIGELVVIPDPTNPKPTRDPYELPLV